MRIRTLLVSVGLLAVVCGAATSQPQPPVPPVPPRLDFYPPTPVKPPDPSGLVTPAVPTPPAPPPEKSVDDLLNELERVQAQKAALEKQEQELKGILRKKLEQQTERLQKLGVTPKDAKMPEPHRVGRIIIELCPAKDEKKVRKAIGLAPGQVLTYPAIEEAYAKLDKLGFPAAKIEVIPGERDSSFKDIRVVVRTLGGF